MKKYTRFLLCAPVLLTGGYYQARGASAAPQQLFLGMSVTPILMGFDAPHATIAVSTAAGAECAAGVTYDDGKRPASFPHIVVKVADKAGLASWTWHHQTHSQGTAAVLCIAGALSRSGTVRFGTGVPQQPHAAQPTATQPVVPPTSTPVPPPTYTPVPSATPVPAAAPGTSPDAPGIVVNASNLHTDTAGASTQPKAGDSYAAVRLTITNNGTQPYEYNPFYFVLEGVDDHIRYKPDALDSNIYNTQLDTGTLAPGQSVSGDIAFEVPGSETRFNLLWEPAPLTPYQAIPIS